jgi:hypothetical protein
MNVSLIIEKLGGTAAVARLCEVEPPSVSEWKRRNHIPSARLMYLRLARPEAFDEQSAQAVSPSPADAA